MKRLLFFLFLLISIFFFPYSAFAVNYPDYQNYVNDFAAIYSPDFENKLNSQLQAIDQKTTNQIAVATIK